jgi:hypothetical protein
MTAENLQHEFEAAYVEEMVRLCDEGIRAAAVKALDQKMPNGEYVAPMLRLGLWAWKASHEALLKKQDQEQEEFLAHLADYDHEDRFHG